MRVVASMLAVGFLVAPAGAATPPRAWPGLVVGYRDLTGAHGYHAAIHEAVAAWNRLGVGVRFVSAPKEYSSMAIVFGKGRCLSGNAGTASRGFQRYGARLVVHACPLIVRPLLIAHELGRVLGLGNDDRTCSLMNSKGMSDGRTFALPSRCTRSLPPSWLPRLVDPRTAAAARAFYAAPAAATTVRLTPIAPPRIDWIEPHQTRGTQTILLRATGRCPTRTDSATRSADVVYAKRGYGGAHYAIDTSTLAPGSYCYRLFNLSATGRPTPSAPLEYVLATAPVAAATVTSMATAGTPVAFADRSTDAGTVIVHWHWDFGDPASGADVVDTGDPAAGRTTTHTYASPGSYTVTLTVADALGRSATTTLAVAVAS